jgi:hypothetical protein
MTALSQSVVCRALPLLAALLVGSTTSAEVRSASAGGFHIHHTATVPVAPAVAYQRLLQIGQWWSSAHTYSGDAHNLSLRVRPDGCFCERLPGGAFVVHMTIGYAKPGETLRLLGGLGPLQEMGVHGALTFSFRAANAGAEVVVDYRAAGAESNRLDQLAPVVDRVLGEQVQRFAAFARGEPLP